MNGRGLQEWNDLVGELSALCTTNLSARGGWLPEDIVYAKALALPTSLSSRCSLLVVWPGAIGRKLRRGGQRAHLPVSSLLNDLVRQ